MSKEFCAGVQILLKRMESNPDEFMGEFGKWSSIVNAVFSRKLGGDATAIRSLTNAEVEALHEKLVDVYRPEFDEYVMKNVLDSEQKEVDTLTADQMWRLGQGKIAQAQNAYGSSWNDPRMLAQNSIRPASIIPIGGGGSGATTMVTSDTSILSRLKKGLGL